MKNGISKVRLAVSLFCIFSAGNAFCEDAKSCLSTDQYKIHNRCPYVVTANWCVVTNRPEFNCKRGFDNSSVLAPGGSDTLWPVRMPRDSISYTHFGGCKGAYTLESNFSDAMNFQYRCSK